MEEHSNINSNQTFWPQEKCNNYKNSDEYKMNKSSYKKIKEVMGKKNIDDDKAIENLAFKEGFFGIWTFINALTPLVVATLVSRLIGTELPPGSKLQLDPPLPDVAKNLLTLFILLVSTYAYGSGCVNRLSEGYRKSYDKHCLYRQSKGALVEDASEEKINADLRAKKMF